MAAALLWAPGAGANDLEFRGEGTLGLQLYDLESPFDSDDFSSFFDQYRYIRDKGKDVPFYLGIPQLDVGWFREDDTPLVRLVGWNPWALNERAELFLDWQRLGLDLDYRRYRSDVLCLYPIGTGQGSGLGTQFNWDVLCDDAAADVPGRAPAPGALDTNDGLWNQRIGIGGELSLRLDDLDIGMPWLRELQLFSRYGRHKGETQDRFLLDEREEVFPLSRFRGNRRELDQRVTTVGGGLVFSPRDVLTGAFDVSFERFREDAPVVTLESLAQSTPGFDPTFCGTFDRSACARAFHFVPDTDRLSGSLDLRGELGPAVLTGGATYSHLEQAGTRSPLQRDLDLGEPEVDTWSLQGAFDVPLTEMLGLNGFAKFSRRSYDAVDDADYRQLAPPGQVDPIYDGRNELDAGLELSAAPVLGTVVALGYRYERVDRTLDFAEPPLVIQPEFNLMNEDSRSHLIYARARARLWRRLQLSGELGWKWAPEVTYARDLERALLAEGRLSYLLPRPIPITFSIFGDLETGDNDEIFVYGASPGSGRKKQYERTEWNLGATISAVPAEDLVLFGTFTRGVDEERFAHLRSTIPRFFGPLGLEFFLDSKPTYESDVNTLALGGSYPLTPALDLSLTSSVTWVEVDFEGSGSTPDVLARTNDIQARISSAELLLGYQLRPGLRLGVGYRWDDFDQDHQHEPLGLDTTVQTLSFDVTVDLGLFTR
ncbi:MAG: hypothetical protein ABFS46_13910 [Myxococcota bacterium]